MMMKRSQQLVAQAQADRPVHLVHRFKRKTHHRRSENVTSTTTTRTITKKQPRPVTQRTRATITQASIRRVASRGGGRRWRRRGTPPSQCRKLKIKRRRRRRRRIGKRRRITLLPRREWRPRRVRVAVTMASNWSLLLARKSIAFAEARIPKNL